MFGYSLNNFRCMIGQKKYGVQFGGDIILKSLKRHILVPNYTQSMPLNISHIDINTNQDYSKGYTVVNKNLKKKIFNINFGGDHSISVSTIQPMLNYYKNDLLVVWIDAHADINTYNSSLTKNKHGMPLAVLTGKMKHWYNINKKHYTLPYNNLIYVGLRDLDQYEIDFIKEKNIKYFACYNKHVIDTINQHPAKYIHISCDIDSMDPKIMPSTGTPVKNGLTLKNVLKIVKTCKKKMVGFDLIEFNPMISCVKDVQKTITNINKIIKCVMYK